MFRSFLKFFAYKNKKFIKYYLKFCRISGEEYATLLKHHRCFYAMGEQCSIQPDAYIAEGKYIKMGNNVRLSSCHLFVHDGVINMLMKAYPVKIDAVGKIEIGNNVFVGHGATVLRNVVVGDNVVIAAGALVANDVPSNSVVGGIPAKFICKTEELVAKLQNESIELPWYQLIQSREGGYDPIMEKELHKIRIKHFFSSMKDG